MRQSIAGTKCRLLSAPLGARLEKVRIVIGMCLILTLFSIARSWANSIDRYFATLQAQSGLGSPLTSGDRLNRLYLQVMDRSKLRSSLFSYLIDKQTSNAVSSVRQLVDLIEHVQIPKHIEVAEFRSPLGIRVYKENADRVVLLSSPAGLGSGILVGDPRRVLTNYHVVASYLQVSILLRATDPKSAKSSDLHGGHVLGIDRKADLALVGFDHPPENLPAVALGDLNALEVGSDVYAIGHPSGLAWTFSEGVVSQIRPDYEWEYSDGTKHRATVIQTQTSINPGNSGGPLFNSIGQLVGVNSFRADGEGLNFAVSVSDVKPFLERVSRGETGLTKEPGQANPTSFQVLEKFDINANGIIDSFSVDLTKDGRPDLWCIDANEDGTIDGYGFDRDGNGTIDSLGTELDSNGRPSIYYFDTNDDGQFDLVGYDDNHDLVVDRYAPFKQ